MNRNELKKVKTIFRALDHDIRMDIFNMLQDGELSVTEITNRLNKPQPTISVHLNILEEAGIIKTEVIGKYRIKTLNRECVSDLDKALTSLSEHVF